MGRTMSGFDAVKNWRMKLPPSATLLICSWGDGERREERGDGRREEKKREGRREEKKREGRREEKRRETAGEKRGETGREERREEKRYSLPPYSKHPPFQILTPPPIPP